MPDLFPAAYIPFVHNGGIMEDNQNQNQPTLTARASRMVIFGTLSFVELSVKLMAGLVIVASRGIKRILGGKPEC